MKSGKYDLTCIARDAGVFTWDLNTDTVYADSALAELFGLDLHTTERGQPIAVFLERIALEDKARIAKAIHQAIVTGETYQQDYSVIRPDGSSIGVAAFGRCFRDFKGDPSHYAGIVCLKVIAPAVEDTFVWHCQRALELAKIDNQPAMVALMQNALAEYKHRVGKVH